MKRLVVCLGIVSVLAVPAVVLAGTPAFPPDSAFQGRIEGDPNTYFGFDRAHETVRHFAIAAAMSCYSGDRPIVQATIDRTLKLERLVPRHAHAPKFLRRLRVFEGSGRVETDAGPGRVDVFGLLRRGGRAGGGIHMATHDPDLGKCYSGYLEWHAKRGAHVTLPAGAP
jgi:hypothetical protein